MHLLHNCESCSNPTNLYRTLSSLLLQGRIYARAIGPWSPLSVARIAKIAKKSEQKLRACPPPPPPPPLQVRHQALGSKSPEFGRKMGRKFEYGQFQILIYVSLKFSEVSAPSPPFQNPDYATGLLPRVQLESKTVQKSGCQYRE